MSDSPRSASPFATLATSVGARYAFAPIEIDPEEYLLMGDHTPRTAVGHADACLVDEPGRMSLVDLRPPAQPQLVNAFDPNDIASMRLDFGRTGQAGVP
jgi:hypothetical protein